MDALKPIYNSTNPISWKTWKHKCQKAGIDDPLANIVINNIKDGCHPGIPENANPRSSYTNFVAPEKTLSVFKDIVNGLSVRFLEGPFDPQSPEGKNTVVSPLQTVDKAGSSKVRVIHNLSKFKHLNLSVNSFIPEESKSVEYTNLYNIVKLLKDVGPEGFCTVWDMFDAYRQVKINKKFHKFMGFQWYGKIYRYTCLPFGLASAPQKYTQFAHIIKLIAIKSKPSLWFKNNEPLMDNYLDDFWAVHHNYLDAWEQFISFLELLQELGIPTQWKKVSPPSKYPKILGFLFNILLQSFAIPNAKATKIQQRILELLNSKFSTPRILSSVKGQLNWVGQVIYPTKAFLRNLDLLIMRPVNWDQRIRLNKEVKNDLKFWYNIITSSRNNISFDYFLRDRKQANIHVWTDAALGKSTGCGGFSSKGDYFQISWNDFRKLWPWQPLDSSGPELFALVIFASFLFLKYPGESFYFHCDNQSAINMIINEKCHGRLKAHMALIRQFISLLFDTRSSFWIQHIPGVLNIEADKLSRYIPNPFDRLFTLKQHDQHIQPFFEKNPKFPIFTFVDLHKNAFNWFNQLGTINQKY